MLQRIKSRWTLITRMSFYSLLCRLPFWLEILVSFTPSIPSVINPMIIPSMWPQVIIIVRATCQINSTISVFWHHTQTMMKNGTEYGNISQNGYVAIMVSYCLQTCEISFSLSLYHHYYYHHQQFLVSKPCKRCWDPPKATIQRLHLTYPKANLHRLSMWRTLSRSQRRKLVATLHSPMLNWLTLTVSFLPLSSCFVNTSCILGRRERSMTPQRSPTGSTRLWSKSRSLASLRGS